jgi:hypothetical protein
MWEVEDRFRIKIGGVTFINVPTLVAYKGESLFTLKRHDENGYLGIYFDIYDDQGKHIASVKRNEIYYGDKDAYQIDGSMNRYVFSERKSGKVLCDIRKREDAHPSEIDIAVLNLYTPAGKVFEATPDQTNLPGNNMFRGMTIQDCVIGIVIA